VSIPAPGVIWRIIEAVSRPIDQPVGPIHLDTADADWLHNHLLAIVTEPTPRTGKRSRNNHYVWVALDVALRLPESKGSPKVAYFAVAKDWGATEKQVGRWETIARETATPMLKKFDRAVLARLVKHNRDVYLKKST
jgi:hypothetical protein